MSAAEYWRFFSVESRDSLEKVESYALAMDAGDLSPETVGGLYRAIHTFKGNCRVMGLTGLETVSHRAEDLIGLVRDEGLPWDKLLGDTVLEVVDDLRRLVSLALEASGDAPEDQVRPVLARVEQHLQARRDQLDGGPPPGAPAPRSSAPPAPPPAPPRSRPPPREERAEASRAQALIDPALDPEFLRIYFGIVEQELGLLSGALTQLKAGDPAGRAALEEVLDRFQHATEQMGFDRLLDTLDALEPYATGDATGTSLELEGLELRVFEELAAVQAAASGVSDELAQELPDVIGLVRRWHADRMFLELAGLRDDIDLLRELATTPDADPRDALRRVAGSLRTLHFGCLLHDFPRTAALAIALVDVASRVAAGEVPLGPAVPDLCLALHGVVATLMNESDEVGQAAEASGATLARLDEVEAALQEVAAGQVTTARAERPLPFELPPEFLGAITPEGRRSMEEALAAGGRAYLVHADLDADPDLAAAFTRWLASGRVTPVTNSYLQHDGRTGYRFLLVGPEEAEALSSELLALDGGEGRLVLMDVEGHPLAGEATTRAAGGPDGDEPARTGKGASSSGALGAQDRFVRIDETKVSGLMDLSAELSLAAGAVLHHPRLSERPAPDLEAAVRRLHIVVRDLQELAAGFRLVPIRFLFRRMQRLIRDLEAQTGKAVDLVVEGDETEIDKLIVDNLYDPLLHILRNAVDHGIEPPDQRRAAGKPEQGRVLLRAAHEGGEVRVTVRDDGRGIDLAAVRARAQAAGLAEEGQALSDDEVRQLVFAPGLSTAGEVSNLSGRGVGMDAVRSAIEGLRGKVSLSSVPGKGTRITLALPLTVAFIEGMVVRIDGRLFVVPVDSIVEVFMIGGDDVTEVASEDAEVVRIREELVPVLRLQEFYGEQAERRALDGSILIVVRGSSGAIGLPVDELIGIQQVTMKPLERLLSGIRAAAGSAILSTGEVALALDCEQLDAGAH